MSEEQDEFERDLEAIFEERAQGFSSELRRLLRSLWSEGVKQGRLLERTKIRKIDQIHQQMTTEQVFSIRDQANVNVPSEQTLLEREFKTPFDMTVEKQRLERQHVGLLRKFKT